MRIKIEIKSEIKKRNQFNKRIQKEKNKKNEHHIEKKIIHHKLRLNDIIEKKTQNLTKKIQE